MALFFASLFFLWVNAGVRQISFFPYKPNQIAVGVLLAVGTFSILFEKWRLSFWSILKNNFLFLGLFAGFVLTQLVSTIWVSLRGV